MKTLLLTAFLAFCGTASAETLRVVSFPGGSNLPVWVAQSEGMFAHENLDVDLVPTTGSRPQMQELLAGGSQIVLTATDNVIAYGATANDPKNPNLSALAFIMGIDPGFQNVVAAHDIHDFADLKNHVVAVDAPDTGYAFALFDILAKHQLQRDTDYKLVAVGGGMKRWDALQSGAASAALQATPLELVAEAKGFHVLAHMDQELGAYAGNGAAVRRDWLATHRTTVDSFVRAVKAALTFLQDPKHRAKAKDLLITRMGGVTPEMADQSLARMLDPESGFSHTGGIDRKGLEVVITLRQKYAPNGPPIGTLARYLD